MSNKRFLDYLKEVEQQLSEFAGAARILIPKVKPIPRPKPKPKEMPDQPRPGEAPTRPDKEVPGTPIPPKPETKPEVKPETKPEVKPETKPEVKPETKPEVKPETKPEVKPETKPEVKPGPGPSPVPIPKPETKPEVKPETKPETKPEVKPAPVPNKPSRVAPVPFGTSDDEPYKWIKGNVWQAGGTEPVKEGLTSMDSIQKSLKIIESMTSAEKNSTGPKFPGYWRGTDPASKAKDRMVGGSEEQQESVLGELDKAAKDSIIRRRLEEKYKAFKEQDDATKSLEGPVNIYPKMFPKRPATPTTMDPKDIDPGAIAMLVPGTIGLGTTLATHSKELAPGTIYPPGQNPYSTPATKSDHLAAIRQADADAVAKQQAEPVQYKTVTKPPASAAGPLIRPDDESAAEKARLQRPSVNAPVSQLQPQRISPVASEPAKPTSTATPSGSSARTEPKVEPITSTNTAPTAPVGYQGLDPSGRKTAATDPRSSTFGTAAPSTDTAPAAALKPTTYQELQKLNPLIKDANKIYVGQKITAPNGDEYTVQKGDTLSKIAADWNKQMGFDVKPTQAPTKPATGSSARIQPIPPNAVTTQYGDVWRDSQGKPVTSGSSTDADGRPIQLPPAFASAQSDEERFNNKSLPLSVRHNNPGNLIYVGQQGATKGGSFTGPDGKTYYYARFETPEAGIKAQQQQIELDTQKRGMDLGTFLKKYEPVTYTSYGDFIKQRMGLGPNDRVPPDRIQELQQVMAELEAGRTKDKSRLAHLEYFYPEYTARRNAEIQAQKQGTQVAMRESDDKKVAGRYSYDEFDELVKRLGQKAKEQEKKHGPVDLGKLMQKLRDIDDKDQSMKEDDWARVNPNNPAPQPKQSGILGALKDLLTPDPRSRDEQMGVQRGSSDPVTSDELSIYDPKSDPSSPDFNPMYDPSKDPGLKSKPKKVKEEEAANIATNPDRQATNPNQQDTQAGQQATSQAGTVQQQQQRRDQALDTSTARGVADTIASVAPPGTNPDALAQGIVNANDGKPLTMDQQRAMSTITPLVLKAAETPVAAGALKTALQQAGILAKQGK